MAISINTADGTFTTPDMLQIAGTTTVAAAPIATVLSPLPAIGEKVILQLVIPGLFTFDARHTIAHDDTPASVAAALAACVNSGAGIPNDQIAMAGAGVFAVVNPGASFLSITNPSAGVVTLQDVSTTSAFTIEAGAAGWDSGPDIAIQKGNLGTPPPIGSNLAQVIFSAPGVANPAAFQQYLTVGVNSTGDTMAEFCIYSQNGSVEILKVSESGLWFMGKQIA